MKQILSFITILMLSYTASAQVDVSKSNDNLYLTILAVVLTLILAFHGMIRVLLSNPIMVIFLGIGLILVYILFSAIMVAFGIGEWIDSSIQSTANTISTLRGV